MNKQKVQSNINLEELAGGAFAEKLNEALVQVAENIQNQNTEATAKRGITVNIKFAPNKSRQIVNTSIAVTTKLAATEAIDTQMVMGVDIKTGKIEIAEYDGQVRGQASFADILRESEEPEAEEPHGLEPGRDFDTETGEIYEAPKTTDKPLDLKNRGKVVQISGKAAQA